MSDAPVADGAETIAARHVAEERKLPWQTGCSSPADAAAALAFRGKRKAMLEAVVRALLPLRPRLGQALKKSIQEVLAQPALKSTGSGPTLRGVGIEQRPECGRALIAGVDLERGAAALREYPLECVQLCEVARAPGCRLGPGSLSPETALALRLWRSDALGDQNIRAAGQDLLDHGGGDALMRRERAVIAVICVLVAGPEWDVEETTAAAVALFSWLGRVRVNAVAVTAVTERDGDMETAKVALALYPGLASSVNHSCRPNALLRFGKDQELSLLVSSPAGVRPGQEITISYGPLAATLPCTERSPVLLGQYGFECTCRACSSQVSEDFSWRARAEALDARARKEVAQECWKAAAVASSAALAALREGYDDGDIELAREECKLAGLLLRSGDVSRAQGCWASAVAVLQPLVVPEDPDLVEAVGMLEQLPKPAPKSVAKRTSTTATPVSANRGAKHRAAAVSASAPCALFRKASSHKEIGAAITRMCAAMENGKAQAKTKTPPCVLPGGVSSQNTTIGDFTGTVLGIESLGLSAEEKARLAVALQEPLSRDVTQA